MIDDEQNQAAEDANAPQDTIETVDEPLQSAPEPEQAAEAAPVAGIAPVEASGEQVESDLTGLIEVTKDGVFLHVHPDTVAAHVAAGWSLV